MNTTTNSKRNRKNGQYTYSTMETVCARCGNTLGNHEAEAPHANYDLVMGPECEGFKKIRAAKVAK